VPFVEAGDLDRWIVIEKETVTRNKIGEATRSWTTFAEVWAQKNDSRGKEVLSFGREQAHRASIFTIRWREGLTPLMRIVHDGLVYDIVSIAELKRRELLEITAEARPP
jgi:SPP1 family predicted phage head-tail adaptor